MNVKLLVLLYALRVFLPFPKSGVSVFELRAYTQSASRHHGVAAESTSRFQVEDVLDDLEKTLTFVSPVKDGLGASALDRTLRDDHRGEVFFKELAKIEADRKAINDAARAAKTLCGLSPIGEVRCGAVQCVMGCGALCDALRCDCVSRVLPFPAGNSFRNEVNRSARELSCLAQRCFRK